MTETVSGASTRKGKAAQAGRARLRMQRIHTTPGVHPYDQVTWERRDVVMTNWRDGSVNFEQHGVEFPDFWSVNAANIVTTKYFRGAVGSPQREWSLKQLIDRVVGTYEKAGQDHGYFATDEDAEIFGHELRVRPGPPDLQLQLPGLVQRRHPVPAAGLACFILAVDDTMDSILEWYREEGLIFKGGSGRRRQPVQDPLEQGAAVLRRHRQRPGLLHARRRRLGRHDQVRRRHPARGQDGRARRRPPRRGRVHRDQGARGREDPRAPRRRVRHGPGRQGHRQRPVPERQQLGPGLRRVHARGARRARSSTCWPGAPARWSSGRRAQADAQHGAGRLGVRRPRHPVRRHDQRLAHLPRVRPDHRQQPVQRVRPPGQLLLQPGQHQPAQVPPRRRHLRRRAVRARSPS